MQVADPRHELFLRLQREYPFEHSERAVVEEVHRALRWADEEERADLVLRLRVVEKTARERDVVEVRDLVRLPELHVVFRQERRVQECQGLDDIAEARVRREREQDEVELLDLPGQPAEGGDPGVLGQDDQDVPCVVPVQEHREDRGHGEAAHLDRDGSQCPGADVRAAGEHRHSGRYHSRRHARIVVVDQLDDFGQEEHALRRPGDSRRRHGIALRYQVPAPLVRHLPLYFEPRRNVHRHGDGHLPAEPSEQSRHARCHDGRIARQVVNRQCSGRGRIVEIGRGEDEPLRHELEVHVHHPHFGHLHRREIGMDGEGDRHADLGRRRGGLEGQRGQDFGISHCAAPEGEGEGDLDWREKLQREGGGG